MLSLAMVSSVFPVSVIKSQVSLSILISNIIVKRKKSKYIYAAPLDEAMKQSVSSVHSLPSSITQKGEDTMPAVSVAA
jgi:hypothetical protein